MWTPGVKRNCISNADAECGRRERVRVAVPVLPRVVEADLPLGTEVEIRTATKGVDAGCVARISRNVIVELDVAVPIQDGGVRVEAADGCLQFQAAFVAVLADGFAIGAVVAKLEGGLNDGAYETSVVNTDGVAVVVVWTPVGAENADVSERDNLGAAICANHGLRRADACAGEECQREYSRLNCADTEQVRHQCPWDAAIAEPGECVIAICMDQGDSAAPVHVCTLARE